jgi:hypothetical protein
MCYKNTCARRQQIAEAMRIMKKNSAEFGCDHIESWDNQGNVSSDGRR